MSTLTHPGALRSALLRSVLDWAVPGVARVRAQKEPFAAAWRAANEAALDGEGPLWAALGDSMTQGIGAAGISGGWVSQLHDQLAAQGRRFRLVNLSVTGARVGDVVDDQLPRLEALGVTPDLVTVLIGANDMFPRSRRPAAVGWYAALLDRLPAGRSVVAPLPQRNKPALAINALIGRAAARGQVRVAEFPRTGLRSLFGTLAEDHFHPNELGYARIAAAFRPAIDRLGAGQAGPA
ncbi:MAG TPA: SGNH/GDSL hydrolase family protein [Streptosporangiaceae bacterium]